MVVIIHIKLKNSALHETPETIKSMISQRMDDMIRTDPVVNMFVAGYTVGVEK